MDNLFWFARILRENLLKYYLRKKHSRLSDHIMVICGICNAIADYQ
ncbi:hypothetical protein AA700_1451 [Acidiphilium acidophilum DSM 700]|nr:hypothetical protein AA700_1451 [Acidiphilium acidophilum DSM 700]